MRMLLLLPVLAQQVLLWCKRLLLALLAMMLFAVLPTAAAGAAVTKEVPRILVGASILGVERECIWHTTSSASSAVMPAGGSRRRFGCTGRGGDKGAHSPDLT